MTVASLALADAGIDCLDLLPACTVVIPRPLPAAGAAAGDGAATPLFLDPTEAEERGAGAATTLALMPSSGLLAFTEHVGEAPPGTLAAALGLAADACAGLAARMRDALVDAHARRVAKGGAKAPGGKRAA
jgi:ribonuclease PH